MEKNVVVKVSEALDGETMEDVIPSLTLILAQSGLSSEIDLEEFIRFVTVTIALYYKSNEKPNDVHIH